MLELHSPNTSLCGLEGGFNRYLTGGPEMLPSFAERIPEMDKIGSF